MKNISHKLDEQYMDFKKEYYKDPFLRIFHLKLNMKIRKFAHSLFNLKKKEKN